MNEAAVLTRDEAVKLVEKAQSGDEAAMDELAMRNMALVRSVASRFRERGAEPDDLMQIGSVGLIKAVMRFDPAFGTAFSTYAVPMIAGEIRRFLRDDGIIKVSRRYKELVERIARIEEEEARLGRPAPHITELASRLGVTAGEAVSAMEAALPVRSLSEPASRTDPDICRGDLIPDPAPMESAADDRVLIFELTRALDEREKRMIKLRYYLGLTQAETAKRLGISQVQVSRLESKALNKLRERAAE